MSANPERDVLSLVEPIGDDADQLRSLVSAMLSGTYQEESYLWDVASLCHAKPEFGRRLLALLERYSRLGQMPAAQYTRIRQRIEESLPPQPAAAAPRAARRDDTARPARAPKGRERREGRDGRARNAPERSGNASTVTAAVPDPTRPKGPSADSTVTAPLPSASPQPARPPPPSHPIPRQTRQESTGAAPAATGAAAGAASGAAPMPAPAPVPAPVPTAAATAAPTPRPPAASPPPLDGPAADTAAARRERMATRAGQPEPPRAELIIEPGAVLRERYELESLLGCGGMAAVYKALDRYRASLGVSDCHVALKIVAAHSAAPADDAALGREFHNAQQLSHPNIINVFEIDHEAGATFYTMELLEGEKLDELLARIGGPLPPAQALTIVRDLGRAIEHAHSRGILHADLKPQNVFITFGGQVRVLDFGGLSMPAPEPWISEPGAAAAPERYRTATPAYASCEQLEGQQVDPRDDVYALACIAYELLTGRHPFDGHTALQARAQHMHPRRPAQLTASSWRALRRALSWQRAQRPRDVGPWLEQLGVSAAAVRLPPSYELRVVAPRTRWGRWTALAVSVLLCAGAVLYVAQHAPDAPGPPDWNRLLASAKSSLQQTGTALQRRLGLPRGMTGSPARSLAPPAAQDAAAVPAPAAPAPATGGGAPLGAGPSGAAAGALVAGSAAGAAHAMHHPHRPADTVIASAAHVPPADAAAPPPAAGATPAQALQFSSSSYQVKDSSPAARVVVRRSGDTQDELRFVWWTLDDTAKADVDYAPLGRRTEHMLPGQDHVTLYVPIISNPLRHETATFYVALGRPGTPDGSPSARASVTIERGG